jgi:raffinose/stachyose/melibiose transport system permease protein
MAKEISLKRVATYWPMYFFVLPSALLVAVFAYYPAGSAMYHAFYRWNGDYINNFVGFGHFRRALGVPAYWILALAALVAVIAFSKKQGPVAIATKVVGGIVSMVITLALLAKLGALKALESGSWVGPIFWSLLFALTAWLGDRESDSRPSVLLVLGTVVLAGVLSALGVASVAAWALALLAVGVLLWIPAIADRLPHRPALRGLQALVAMGISFWALALHTGGDRTLWGGFAVISILVVANILKMVPSIATAVVIHRLKSDAANYWYRVLFVIPMIIPGMVYLLIWKFFFEADSVFNLILEKTGLLALLVKLDLWLGWGGIFIEGTNPIWLNDTNLVLPALILWGFPWVGVVGVLIYLAGLQGIGESVYEAADLDGVTAFQKFLHIEFPLILTQVRINLVLMIIGTLQMYAFILILFGIEGGPNGKLMVPGLYMFRSAFQEGYAGYACCIGLIIFVFILVLTELNNRFVRVEK